MRGVLISLAIIFFCLSVEVLYMLDDAVYVETGDRFLQARTQEPYLDRDSLPNVQAGTSGLNETLEYTSPQQQISGVSEVMGFFGFVYQSFLFLIKTLFYSTAGFYWWAIQNLHFPQYLALTGSLLVNMAHALAVVQWLSGKDIRGGG